MYMFMVCVATAALGVDVSWKPSPEGGVEYLIQLDPQTLELLRAGEAVESQIPPAAGNVRSYRITAGTKKLPPRETPPAPVQIPKSTKFEEPPTALHALLPDPGGKPLVERTAIYVEQPNSTAVAKPQPKAAAESPPEAPGKPWFPLTFTLFGLFASIGANVFLGWIAWDSRRQLAQRKAAETS